MAHKKTIYYAEACDRCGGTGFESGPDEFGDPAQTECPKCLGTGRLVLGQLSDAFIADIDTIKDNVDTIKDMVQQILDFHSIT